MRRTLLAATCLWTLALLLAAPAMAQNTTETDIDVMPGENDGENVDVDVVPGDGGAEESTFAGLSTTVVIVLIVLAVLVVALVVAMASRGP